MGRSGSPSPDTDDTVQGTCCVRVNEPADPGAQPSGDSTSLGAVELAQQNPEATEVTLASSGSARRSSRHHCERVAASKRCLRTSRRLCAKLSARQYGQ